MKLAASHRVYILGAMLWAALTISTRHFGDRGGASFLVSMGAAAIVYLLAIREFFCTPRFPRRVVVIGLLMAAVWQLQFLGLQPGSDDDIYRYVWDGRVQRLGYNPYILVPSDPAVRGLHTSETGKLNNPDLPSPYPAGAQLFFRAVTAIHESALALRVAFVICDFALAFVLLDVLRHSGRGAHLVLTYAWSPLLAMEVAGSGHIDIVGALLLAISFAALRRYWRTTAAVTFGLAVAVKLLPVVLLPLYWKRVRMRDGALAAAAVALLYVPFLEQGRFPIGSLITYVQTFRFNDPVFAGLEGVAPQIAAGLPLIFGFVTAIRLRSMSTDAIVWPMTVSLLCAPVVYPWYLLWLLPFVQSAPTLPILFWTVSIIPTYVVWHLRPLGRPWLVPGWVLLLEYGAVAAAGVAIGLRRLRRPASSCLLDHAG